MSLTKQTPLSVCHSEDLLVCRFDLADLAARGIMTLWSLAAVAAYLQYHSGIDERFLRGTRRRVIVCVGMLRVPRLSLEHDEVNRRESCIKYPWHYCMISETLPALIGSMDARWDRDFVHRPAIRTANLIWSCLRHHNPN